MDITIANFEAEVIEASMQTPVLVDFWAPWCGPCKSLGPVLEKLERDYAGRFKLAKINSDDEQQLAAAFGVRSIPTCVLLIGGRPVDGFMGALPEGQVRQFLDRHLPSEAELASEAETEEAEELMQSGDAEAALDKLREALAVNPANDDARFDYVRLLISVLRLDEADIALKPALAVEPRALRFEALNQWLQSMRFAVETAHEPWSRERLDAALAANKRDFDARFAFARTLFAQGDPLGAMDELLEIIMRDKKWADEAPRKLYVAVLELITPPRSRDAGATPGKTAGGIELAGKSATPDDPQVELVSRYRRKLSMALN